MWITIICEHCLLLFKVLSTSSNLTPNLTPNPKPQTNSNLTPNSIQLQSNLPLSPKPYTPNPKTRNPKHKLFRLFEKRPQLLEG